MPTIDILRGRKIYQESASWFLLETDVDGTPGYWTLEPKKHGLRGQWSLKVLKHLQAFSEPISSITNEQVSEQNAASYQAFQSYPFHYKGGDVRVHLDMGRVEIQKNHPDLLSTANTLAGFMKNQIRGSSPMAPYHIITI